MSHRNAFTIFVLYLIFLNILKIFLAKDRERESRGGGAERESQAGPTPSGEPNMGPDPTTLRP